jgi:hypothetical protein
MKGKKRFLREERRLWWRSESTLRRIMEVCLVRMKVGWVRMKVGLVRRESGSPLRRKWRLTW